MAKNLLIVESPAKARTISKYLGPGFVVKASVGHVVDLPARDLGVDIAHGFAPQYQVIPGKEKVVKELKKAADQAEAVFLAPDPDREGEAIAMHIAQQLGRPLDAYHRVLFHELTKPAIQKAVAEPQKLNQRLYDSQQARRVLDRLVGYQISPLLWDKVKRGLSAGRVQSVALRLVVDREREVRAFVPQEYWDVTAHLAAQLPPPFKAKVAKLGGKKFEPRSQAEAQAAIDALQGAAYLVAGIKKRRRQQRPAPPFITSTLQQEAFRKLGLSPKRTMALAQRLYEGLETAEGQVGLITYMRTDSTRLAASAVAEAREAIAGRFGPEYLPKAPNVYKAKSAAQDAHEAIRPTSAARTPESLESFLKRDELRLYRLIYHRFLACQMAPAEFDQTQLEIEAGPALLRASGQVLAFKGFMAVYVEDKDEEASGKAPAAGNEAPGEAPLPPVKEGERLDLVRLEPRQHFTTPPPRFTEASLVKELEEKGIGRPSTYAAILSTLQDKEYVGKDPGKKLLPSELGLLVNDLLMESFPGIMEVDFTAGLERSLDKVEEGDVDWRQLLGEFYGPFARAVEAAKGSMRQIKGKGVKTEVACPQCGQPLLIRLGKHGEFLACSAYPGCKFTSDFTRDDKGGIVLSAPAPDPGVACDKCGAPMQLKNGRYGPFLACSAYPACKNIMNLDRDGRPQGKEEPTLLGEKCPQCGKELLIKPTRSGGKFISCSGYPKCRYSRGLPTGVNCPQCGGELVEKRSRRGKVFYGCANYPKCDYASWDRPVPEACPACGHPFLVEKTARDKSVTTRCPSPGCGYVKPTA